MPRTLPTKGDTMEPTIIWQSTITEKMVSHLNGQELSLLIETLDDAVASIGEDYEL